MLRRAEGWATRSSWCSLGKPPVKHSLHPDFSGRAVSARTCRGRTGSALAQLHGRYGTSERAPARRFPGHSKQQTLKTRVRHHVTIDGDGEETAHSAHDQGRRCGVTSISNRGVGGSHTKHDPSRIPDLRLMSSLAAGWRPSHELRERHRRGADAPTRGAEIIRESGFLSAASVRHEVLRGGRSPPPN